MADSEKEGNSCGWLWFDHRKQLFLYWAFHHVRPFGVQQYIRITRMSPLCSCWMLSVFYSGTPCVLLTTRCLWEHFASRCWLPQTAPHGSKPAYFLCLQWNILGWRTCEINACCRCEGRVRRDENTLIHRTGPVSRHLPRRTKENHEDVSVNWCPRRVIFVPAVHRHHERTFMKT
jgi:hypothetical protein